MYASYADYCKNKSGSLWQCAEKLRHNYMKARGTAPRLPSFILMSDPERIPDILYLAQQLPKGAALIYRHYGATNRFETAERLRAISGLVLLIGNDPELATSVKADGVHMPRATTLGAIKAIRKAHLDWIITQAAPKALGPEDGNLLKWAKDNAADNQGLIDGLLLSAIFPSKSPSTGPALGTEYVKNITELSDKTVFALGGITAQNAAQLTQTGCAGLAAIEGISREIIISAVKAEMMDYGQRLTYRRMGHDIMGHDIAELTLIKINSGLYNAAHTGVPKSLGGQGVGKALIEAMSHHARANHYKIIPNCPFIAAVLRRRPDLAANIIA